LLVIIAALKFQEVMAAQTPIARRVSPVAGLVKPAVSFRPAPHHTPSK
jgi:hypothetical protein